MIISMKQYKGDKMEKELEVKCKVCGETFRTRFDIKELDDKIPMAFCPNCQKMVEVLSREFAQYST